MRIVWLSANRLGYELLEKIFNLDGIWVEHNSLKVDAIVTLTEDSKTKMYDGIKDNTLWHEIGVPIYEIEDINDEGDLLKAIQPDLVVLCGWRQIISKEILEIPKLGFIGFHPTLLPVGRGHAPIINSILEGFEKSGVTLFHLSETLDDGDIIGQCGFSITKDDHAFDVYEKVIEAGKVLIQKCFPLLAEGNAPRTPQDELKATYFKKRTLEDNKINLEDGLETAHRKIKAFSHPYLGAFVEKDGKKLIIWKAELR